MADDASAEITREMTEGVQQAMGRRGVQDRRNHLTLVELKYAFQTSKLPKRAWEPISFMYKEYLQLKDKFIESKPAGASEIPVGMSGRFVEVEEVDGVKVRKIVREPLKGGVVATDDVSVPDEWLTDQRDYIHMLVLNGNNIEGWKAGHLTNAITSDRQWQEKPAAAGVAGNPQTGQPEAKGVKRGLLRRG